MNKLFFIFFYLSFINCNFIQSQNIDPESVTHTIECAKQYRINRELDQLEEKEREQEILNTACDALTTYFSISIESGVKQFLEETLSLKVDDFDLVDVRETDFFGKSEARVFLIKDHTGVLLYVVKAFLYPRTLDSRFLQEISAIDLIQQLSLPDVDPIQQYAFALCQDGEEEWGLLLESPAKGKRLDQYVYEVGHAEAGSETREQMMHRAAKAFNQVGAAIAHLHAPHAATLTSIPPILVAKCDLKLADVLNNPFVVKELEKRMALEEFAEFVGRIKSEALSVPLYYTYVHGDAHLGNIFYDEAHDSCTFIDLAGSHRSIDLHAQPILYGAIDLVRIEDSLRFKADGLLSPREIGALNATFNEGYAQAGGELPDDRLMAFYHMYVKLRRLASKSNYPNEPDPRIQASDRLIFEDALHYFEQEKL